MLRSPLVRALPPRAVQLPVVPRRALLLASTAVALALLSLLGVLATPAAAGALERRSAVTAAQERVVLRLVDDVCGDTWCEGDHAIRFRSFTCHPRRGCVLRIGLAHWSPEPLRWHERSARIRGFPRFSDMVDTAPDGGHSLRPAFYEAVGRAMRAMTDTLR